MNSAIRIKKAYVLYSGVLHPLQQGVLKARKKRARRRRAASKAGPPAEPKRQA